MGPGEHKIMSALSAGFFPGVGTLGVADCVSMSARSLRAAVDLYGLEGVLGGEEGGESGEEKGSRGGVKIEARGSQSVTVYWEGDKDATFQVMQLPSPSGVKGSAERGTEAVADVTPTVSSVGRSCASNASFDAPTTPSTPSRSASLRFEAGARNLFVEGEWRGVVSSSGGG